ncbi:hypothetical protein MNBD_ALPHA05-846 [hydrothermal vent metagenome]|uniref:Uncharacterized protein n=1 Tax=hydrothermal vent metagenome TaxID=652676 RepID=A0A3B0SDS4_9ZZZZ
MISRRITEHVKAQNWFAVGIDFIIVVVGVFIGLQVSNWNDARADQVRAHEFLERLHSDLAGDASSIRVRIEFNEDVLGYANQALAYAEENPSVRNADWPTVLAFFQASQLFPYSSINATYDELRSAGELGLINNQNLRAALAVYYITGSGVQASYIIRLVPEYRKTIRGLTPSVVMRHIWDKCHDESGFEQQRLLPCETPIPENQTQSILAAYLDNPDMLAQLRFWISTLITLQNLLAENEKIALDLAAQIEAELE